MAVAKKKVQAKAKKTSSAAKKTAKPAAKTKHKGKGKAKLRRPAVKGASRTAQAKPAAKKITGKKKPAPKKTAAAKVIQPVAQKKVAVKITAATKAVVRKTRKVLTSAIKKKTVGHKPQKKTAVPKKPAAPQKSIISVNAASDRLRGLKGMLIARRDGILKVYERRQPPAC
jgi:hypothetical protein